MTNNRLEKLIYNAFQQKYHYHHFMTSPDCASLLDKALESTK